MSGVKRKFDDSTTVLLNQSIEQIPSCPNCHGHLRDPKIASKCGHFFCCECYENMPNFDGNNFCCPLCRQSNGAQKKLKLDRVTPGDLSVDSLKEEKLGVLCPHDSSSSSLCQHCCRSFCSVCIVSHLERLRIEIKWINGSFENRLKTIERKLNDQKDGKKRLVKEIEKIQDVIDKEAQELIDIISRKRTHLKEEVVRLVGMHSSEVDRHISIAKDAYSKIPEFNKRFSRSADFSVMFCSPQQLFELYRELLGYDRKIFGAEVLNDVTPVMQTSSLFEDSKRSLEKTLEEVNLKIKLDTNIKSSENQSTENPRLLRAINSNNLEEVKNYFERCGPLPDMARAFFIENEVPDIGLTPLSIATASGSRDIVEYLIKDCGADFRHKNSFCGDAAIHLAARLDKAEVFKFLVEYDQENLELKNRDGSIAFIEALESGSVNVVKYLLEECEYDVEFRTPSTFTPFLTAVSRNHLELMKYLLETGKCDYKARLLVPKPLTAVHLAIRHNAVDAFRYMISHLPDSFEIKLAKENELVLYSVANSNPKIFEMLADFYSNKLNFSNLINMDCLHFAAMKGAVEIGRLLIEKYEADCSKPCQRNGKYLGCTPLYMAVDNNQTKFVTMLLEFCPGLALEKLPHSDETVLSVAKKNGFEEMVATLNSYGAL